MDDGVGEDSVAIETGVVQYLGVSGSTLYCLEALDTVLNSGVPPLSATVASGDRVHANEHLIVLWGWGHTEALVVPSGFSSGYPGEGPRGFSLALCILRNSEIPTSLIRLRDGLFDQVDGRDCPVVTLRTIKRRATPIDTLECGWILKTHATLLLDRRLHTALYWRDKGVAWTADADLVGQVCEKAGDKLVAAAGLLRSGATREECQQCGILVRDAWIELCQLIRSKPARSEADILGNHDVKGMLRTFHLDDNMVRGCSQAYSDALALHHRRGAELGEARTCFETSTTCMATLVKKFGFK